VNGEDVASRMWLELSALAPDRWPAIRRAVAARIAAGLLAELDGLPRSASRLDLYKKRLAAAPDQIREYRFLARAYLYAGARDEAGKVIAAGRKLDPGDDGLLELEAELLDASGRRDEALAIWQMFKQRGDPENLEPYYMSAFTLEALGRYAQAAAEWRHIIDWHEAHDSAIHAKWPKEMLEGIQAKIAAADAGDTGSRQA
jgi:tetratricopeptide (TPR) repeat protein